MAGIYIHIPFCKKACHYCNFHFSTSLHRKPALIQALIKEIQTTCFPAGVIAERTIETLYFGGGTPSILSANDLEQIFTALRANFNIHLNAEITLEANPDNITADNLSVWKNLGINRLSIGVQSFSDADLRWMNRAHSSSEAISCISLARNYGFDNFSIDLIYGTPTLTDEQWEKNVAQAIALGVNHMSCYALTVEEKTALYQMIKKGSIAPVQEEKQSRHFEMLMQWMQDSGFEHYEISNFALPGHRSKHNSNYWSGKPYYGFGPSAHSFDGDRTRWWNIANNALYTSMMENSEHITTHEMLTQEQRINEKIMTSLRTIEGIKVDEVKQMIHDHVISPKAFDAFWKTAKKMQTNGLLEINAERIILSKKGKFFADGIAADLFL
jgi:oxygen-independent coproporphyrinogen-3 oxidase